MPKKRIFSEEEKQKIIEMNNKKYSYNKIAKELNCCYDTIRKFMQENNIEKTKYSLKNHDINENYFSIIDTEEKAYFLGLLKTDGYVKKQKNCSSLVGIMLKTEDKYMIEKFKEALNSDVVILHDKRENKECYGIEIINNKICEDLKKFDIVPNKTYLLTDIKLELIPEELQRHYLRGLLDGDGTIYIDEVSISVGFCGYSKNFVESFQLAIDNVIGKTQHNKISKNNAYACKWKGNVLSKKILEYLYKDSTIFLERKKKFYDLLKDK